MARGDEQESNVQGRPLVGPDRPSCSLPLLLRTNCDLVRSGPECSSRPSPFLYVLPFVKALTSGIATGPSGDDLQQ